MHEHPRAPRHEARHFRFVDDRFASSDRRHRSQIFILKRAEIGLPFDQLHDIFVRERRLLSRNRSHRRQRSFHIAVHETRAIADRKHISIHRARHHQIFVDFYAPVANALAAAFLYKIHRANARRPDHRLGRNLRAALELEHVAVVIDNLSVEHHVDALAFEHADGFLLQILRHHRQHVPRRLDQHHAHIAEVEIMKFFLLHFNQLGDRARLFDARRSAAHHHERQYFFALGRRNFIRFARALELMQHVIANRERLLNRFHSVGVRLNIFHPEEIRRRARRQDQIIVRNLAVIGQHHVARLINALRLRHEQLHIFIVAEERADRISDLVGREHRRRHLIQKRLKQMEIMTVNQSDVDVFFCKQFSQLDPAEASADYHDSRFSVCHCQRASRIFYIKNDSIIGENFNRQIKNFFLNGAEHH